MINSLWRLVSERESKPKEGEVIRSQVDENEDKVEGAQVVSSGSLPDPTSYREAVGSEFSSE